jgi:small-conductance mechanosensitive channel
LGVTSRSLQKSMSLIQQEVEKQEAHAAAAETNGQEGKEEEQPIIISRKSVFQNLVKMARGQQKIQAQAKANEKAATIRKQAGHSAADNKKTAAAGLKFACTVCKAQMPDPKTYKQHFENKHSKTPLPEELKDIVT